MSMHHRSYGPSDLYKNWKKNMQMVYESIKTGEYRDSKNIKYYENQYENHISFLMCFVYFLNNIRLKWMMVFYRWNIHIEILMHTNSNIYSHTQNRIHIYTHRVAYSRIHTHARIIYTCVSVCSDTCL